MFVVPFLLSFDRANLDSRGRPSLKMGRGEAGWTIAEFPTREEARRFADAVPACSRVPNHGVEERQ